MKAISLVFVLLASCSSYKHDESANILRESLRQCYVESDSYTGKDGTVQGILKVALRVDPQGKIKGCRITEDAFKDPNLSTCVCDVLKRGTIPHDKKEEIEVIQPINFYPGGQ